MLLNTYTDNKSNETVVFLHGFGGNHRVWKHQIPILCKNYNILTIDLPSHNEGNFKLTQIDISIKSVSLEIIKILNYYNITNAIFVGVSLGTIFIKYIEEYFPCYVSKALMVGAVCDVGLFLQIVVKTFSKIGNLLPANFVYTVFSKVLMPAKESKKSREIFCKYAKILNRHEFKAWMHIFKENFSFGKRFNNKKHKNNLYIAGIKDYCFLKGIRSEVEQTKSKLIVLQSCGHVCNIDQKEKFNQMLIDFLETKAII